jgi:DUF1365 family protein
MPKILKAKIFHKRLRPNVNAFSYSSYYIYFNPEKPELIKNKILKINKFGLQSFYFKDHGERTNQNPSIWARNILKKFNINESEYSIKLLTMPRILGYVFNPVSFWLFFDGSKNLRAVIAEVNNTFKQTHSYLISNDDNLPIEDSQIFNSQKVFHVSPFLNIEGYYEFKFKITENNIGIWIDYFDNNGEMLKTSIVGNLENFSRSNLVKNFIKIPFITIKTIFLIHYQAVKLLIKKARYYKKPKLPEQSITKSI